MAPKNKTSIDIGKRLKELRVERKLSMRSLARNSGLSTNALSMIERNITSPSVSSLNKIADALGVPMAAFFQEDMQRQKIVFQKNNDHVSIPFLRGYWKGLGGENFEGEVEPFFLYLEVGGGSGKHSMVHSGHEFIYCLEGQIEYEVDGERFILEKGDSLLFGANLKHRWRNMGHEPASAIIVLAGYEQGEKPSNLHVISSREELD
ncbi:MAG: helix-turn-helix domain-containing protein [Anaerolineales bacterium]